MSPSPAIMLAATRRPQPAPAGGTVSLVGISNGGGYGGGAASEPAGSADGDLLIISGTGFDDPARGGRTLAAAGITVLAISPAYAELALGDGDRFVYCFTWVGYKVRSGAGGPYRVSSNQTLSYQTGTFAATSVMCFRGTGGTPTVAIASRGVNTDSPSASGSRGVYASASPSGGLSLISTPYGNDYALPAITVPSAGSMIGVCMGSYNYPGNIVGGGLSWTTVNGPHFEARIAYTSADAGTYSGVVSTGSDGYQDSWVAFVLSP